MVFGWVCGGVAWVLICYFGLCVVWVLDLVWFSGRICELLRLVVVMIYYGALEGGVWVCELVAIRVSRGTLPAEWFGVCVVAGCFFVFCFGVAVWV